MTMGMFLKGYDIYKSSGIHWWRHQSGALKHAQFHGHTHRGQMAFWEDISPKGMKSFKMLTMRELLSSHNSEILLFSSMGYSARWLKMLLWKILLTLNITVVCKRACFNKAHGSIITHAFLLKWNGHVVTVKGLYQNLNLIDVLSMVIVK